MNAEYCRKTAAGSKHALQALRNREDLREEEQRLRRMDADPVFLEAFRQARALVALKGALALGFRVRELEKMALRNPVEEKKASTRVEYFGYQKASRKGA